MEYTGGLFEHMKNAKPNKPLSKEQLLRNIKQWIKETDRQEPPKRRLLMGANEYEKYKSNPEEYITNFCNSIWL